MAIDVNENLERELKYRIWCLGDAMLPPKEKLKAVEVLVRGGKQSVPLLIECLESGWDPVFLHQTPIPQGPMNPGPPQVARTTVSFMCESILFRIIAPEGTESESGMVQGPRVAWVKSWRDWWRKNQHSTLQMIKHESDKELMRLWARLGDTSDEPPLLPKKGEQLEDPPVSEDVAAAFVAALGDVDVSGSDSDGTYAKERERYKKAKQRYKAALKDPEIRGLVRVELKKLGTEEPRLTRHCRHWEWKLKLKGQD